MMNGSKLISILVTLLTVLALNASAADKTNNVKPKPSGAAASAEVVQLRGRVVCLPEEMHKLHGTDLPTKHDHLYGFKTNDGDFYTLLRTKISEALFADQRLREKELLLRGRVLPKTQIFDLSSMKSVRDGVVHDLYYYCTLCDIQTVSPEICACCQGPVELVEKPL